MLSSVCAVKQDHVIDSHSSIPDVCMFWMCRCCDIANVSEMNSNKIECRTCFSMAYFILSFSHLRHSTRCFYSVLSALCPFTSFKFSPFPSIGTCASLLRITFGSGVCAVYRSHFFKLFIIIALENISNSYSILLVVGVKINTAKNKTGIYSARLSNIPN